MLKINRLTN